MQCYSAPGSIAALNSTERSDGQLRFLYAAEGDESAFETLIERYAPMVRCVCWRVLHHQQDAEDAFQKTMLVVMRKAASIKEGEAFKGWLHRVACRTAKDVRKSRDQCRKHECTCDGTQITQIGGDLVLNELFDLICTQVRRLPDKYRLAFVLHCLEGKSATETAAELGLTKGMVASRVRNARKILQRRLARYGIYRPAQSD